MRILFYDYPWGFQKKGGGEIQLLKTKEALEKKGVRIALFNQWQDQLQDYDILHVFGSVKDCLGLMRVAKQTGLKVCVSSIFWTDIRRFKGEQGLKNKSLSFLRHAAKSAFPFFPSGRREIFRIADMIFPNSRSEENQIRRYFFIKKDKFCVVPNGVDEKFKDADSREFVNQYKLKDFILYMGRVEPRKNQLEFIRAMKKFKDCPIVFAGPQTLEHRDYYQACLKEKTPDMHFVGPLDYNSSLLASCYAACRIFCLTSWFETPGLAALEASLAGKNIVVTPFGSTRDYFGDYAFYAPPHKHAEIRKAVKEALNRPFNEDLRKHVLGNYLWSHAAQKTIEGYKRLLNR